MFSGPQLEPLNPVTVVSLGGALSDLEEEVKALHDIARVLAGRCVPVLRPIECPGTPPATPVASSPLAARVVKEVQGLVEVRYILQDILNSLDLPEPPKKEAK